MGQTKALFIATLAAACATTGAKAADLLPPPPFEAPSPPVNFGGGWYLRGDIGVGAVQISGWKSTLQPYDEVGNPLAGNLIQPAFVSIGDQGFIDGGFGYQFNSWFRADVTGEYRSEAEYRAGIAAANPAPPGFLGADSYNAGIRSALFLANGYIDLWNFSGITPFIGGGVGLVSHTFSNLVDSGQGYGVAADRSQTNFAWQVGAGLGFNVTPNFRWEIAYRYLDMGHLESNPIQCLNPQGCFQERHSFNLASQDVRLGFRYLLGGPIAPPLPGPIISKY